MRPPGSYPAVATTRARFIPRRRRRHFSQSGLHIDYVEYRVVGALPSPRYFGIGHSQQALRILSSRYFRHIAARSITRWLPNNATI